MILAAFVSLLGATSFESLPPVSPAAAVVDASMAPQGRPTKPDPGPGGGTPAPAPILLLVGAAAGYGLYRLRRSKSDASGSR